MMKYIFECKQCQHPISYGVFRISAIVKCDNCGKEYLVVKNKMAMALEIVVLFVIALGIRGFIFEANKISNIFMELLIVLAMLVIINVLWDILFVKVLKWKKYFTLVERAMPIPPSKQKNK